MTFSETLNSQDTDPACMSPIRVGLAQGCQQPSNKSGQNPVPRIIAVWIVPLSICPKGTSKAWLNWVSLFFFAREYFRKFVERARYKNALHRLRVFFLHQNCLLIPLFQKPFEVPLHRQQPECTFSPAVLNCAPSKKTRPQERYLRAVRTGRK